MGPIVSFTPQSWKVGLVKIPLMQFAVLIVKKSFELGPGRLTCSRGTVKFWESAPPPFIGSRPPSTTSFTTYFGDTSYARKSEIFMWYWQHYVVWSILYCSNLYFHTFEGKFCEWKSSGRKTHVGNEWGGNGPTVSQLERVRPPNCTSWKTARVQRVV